MKIALYVLMLCYAGAAICVVTETYRLLTEKTLFNKEPTKEDLHVARWTTGVLAMCLAAGVFVFWFMISIATHGAWYQWLGM